MNDDVKVAFDRQILVLSPYEILPSKILPPEVKERIKYKRIISSVAQIGLIEPLVVARQNDGTYLLLDGHVRLDALLAQGATEAKCIVANDDESFTYNKRVNRLAPIQEHYMIVRALERGVPREKLALALDVDVRVIEQRRHMLRGIAPEVIELLKDKAASQITFQKLRKMKPIRQLEVAELMVSANNFTGSYVRALLATSKASDLHRPDQLKRATGLSTEQMARLEREMASVTEDYKELEASYGDDMLVLVVAAGFLERLLSRPEIEKFLTDRHPEFVDNFRAIIAAASLEHPSAAAA
jgi:ParB-like chromosome segregation protein Spo0J